METNTAENRPADQVDEMFARCTCDGVNECSHCEALRRPIITTDESERIDQLLSDWRALNAVAQSRRALVLQEIAAEPPMVAVEPIKRELDEIARMERSCIYELSNLRKRRADVLKRAGVGKVRPTDPVTVQP